MDVRYIYICIILMKEVPAGLESPSLISLKCELRGVAM